jgi:tetratricopeptide (TPR) repeat protein
MERYKIADEKIVSGYDYLERGNSQKACDMWLEAWDDIKSIMSSIGIVNIDKLQQKYQWSEFLSNYVQDLEAELHNTGLENKEYFRKRIKYCEEMLAVCGDEDDLIIENTRRAIADSHFELGNEEECDRLYSMWLGADPNWGWGYIGWSDCYHFGKNKTEAHLRKAEAIITKALEQKDLRDRLDVIERAVEIYQALGNNEKVAELKKEIPSLKRSTFVKHTTAGPIKTEKTGRNDPCPCGSGKKYKKCCGKS